MANKVLIFGGGVAGLTAAHELVDRGFQVEVHEAGIVVGGKARSIDKPNSGQAGRQDLPGEHGFRFFPGFYQHVIDTMMAIPATAQATVAHNLTDTQQVGIARIGKPLILLDVLAPTTPQEWLEALETWFANPELGVPFEEAAFFVGKLLQFMTSCDDRRLGEYEGKKWWDYVEATGKSKGYQDLLARGLTRSLVAMRAETASTRTIATILCQMLFSMADPTGPACDRVLNAPTNTAWINPWHQMLLARGVQFVMGSALDGFTLQNGQIQSAHVRSTAGLQSVSADHYVCAIPKEAMERVTTASPQLAQAAPSLMHLGDLKTDWMTGIQFFLKLDVPILPGHVILSESPWALTLLSQSQFWPGVNLTHFGNGNVAGIFSVDISDWDTASARAPRAKDCTEIQIRDEVWAQLKEHLAFANLQDSNRIDHFLDPAIVFANPTENREQLFINTIGSWHLRPEARTNVPNLFLASDYVQTHTDLATMEGANEAARRAVNALLLAAGSTAQPCAVWPLKEPSAFDAAKQFDQLLWDMNVPHPGAVTILNLTGWI